MPQGPKHGIVLDEWERLLAPLEGRGEELPHLELYRALLASMLQELRETITTQRSMEASKQEASRRIQLLLTDGQKLATLLRSSLRFHYGNRSEKLAELGIQPLRRRSRAGRETTPAAPETDELSPCFQPTPQRSQKKLE